MFETVCNDNSVYRIEPDSKMYEVAISINVFINNKFDEFKEFLDQIQEKVGQIVKLSELPITNVFYDFSKPYYRFSDTEKCFVLVIQRKGPNYGSAGGPTTVDMATIGKLYVTDTNGNEIVEYCKHCKSFVTTIFDSVS